MTGTSGGSRLCYLGASKLRSSAGDFDGVDLRSRDDRELGSLDGVLIDPVKRSLRFFVVASRGLFRRRRCFLLPADCLAQMEPNGHTLRIHLNRREVAGCEEFHRGAVREFSDDDLMDALFPPLTA
jgi:hypothetical protein